MARGFDRLRKALHRPPRYLIARIGSEIARQSRRPWTRLRPRLLSDRVLLRKMHAGSIGELWGRQAASAFFVGAPAPEAMRRRFLDTYPLGERDIVRAAEAVLRHEFDLLGSGPTTLGDPLPWHVDFKTGRRWPLRYCHDLDPNELDRPSDVKVPWELSRCQHFTTLGQAYWLTEDERFAEEFVAQVTDWIRANPFARGINWACPMDVALRAISWIWGFHFFAGSRACATDAFRSQFLRNLLLHGEFLAANIEVDEVNGNHHLVDGAGLVFLGLFFRQTHVGVRWLNRGRRIVIEAMLEQVHEDGVDIEQSIAYHRLVLETFLTTALLLRHHGENPPRPFSERLERMIEFVLAYSKPDGRAPLIGDADDGRMQKLGLQAVGDHRYLLSTGAVLFERGDFKSAAGRFWEESFWLLGPSAVASFERLPAAAAAPASRAFPHGGFYVLRNAAAHVIVDCGEVGLRGLGGHGHNDILSFELHMNGINLVTDCGAYLYTASREWRNRLRSTAAHNTVEVDGEELNRLVDPDELFRLRYDAVPTEVRWGPDGDWLGLRAGHRGYERLPAPVMHVRTILLHPEEPRVLIRDRLESAGVHGLIWRFHLDPGIEARVLGEAVQLSAGERVAWFTLLEGPADLAFRLESGWVSPRYGVKVASAVLVGKTAGRLPVEVSCAFTSYPPDASERARYLDALAAASTHSAEDSDGEIGEAHIRSSSARNHPR